MTELAEFPAALSSESASYHNGPCTSAPILSNWMEHWPEIQTHISRRPRLLLALGFDGILSPTVAQPAKAELPEGTRALLAKLAASPRITLAFLSGRSLRDVQSRVGVADAYYVGNHGMEVRGPGLASSDGLAVSCRSDLVDSLAVLARCTKRLRGVLIEDKGLSVTVHWRHADAAEAATLRDLMDLIVRNHPRLCVSAGEASWELRARASWNKGDALRQIMTHRHLASADAIYLGSEPNDEDAFARLPDGLTFCVGTAHASLARFRLLDPTDTPQFLFSVFCAVNGVQFK
jgi:trehalose-phosphatase